MKLTERSGPGQVAALVSDTLSKAGIRAILTGGGCASIYTRGAYKSVDLDYVLQPSVTQSRLDVAMATAGFERRDNQYFHPRSRFYETTELTRSN